MLSRRALLVSGTAAAVIVGVAGVAHGPGLAKATAPWRMAGRGFEDARLNALSYAILAPNPHNRQPWWFELVGTDRIDIYCDPDRLLPATDPFCRQITIGFGCMLELLRMAAAEQGFRADIAAFPDGAPQPILDGNRMAQVTFVPNAGTPDPLFAKTLERRSLKEPYDKRRPVPSDLVADIRQKAGGQLISGHTVQTDKVQRLKELTWQAWMIEYETDATRRESIDLMRIGNRAITENPDGIELGGLSMGLLNMAGVITPETLDQPGSTAYKTGIDMYRDILETAQGYVWLIAPEKSRVNQLEAGQAWVRLNLAAQAEGLGLHPLSQCLQEFPEMRDPYESIHAELNAPNGGVVHMLGRVGYAKFPAPTPRWPLQSRLITSEA